MPTWIKLWRNNRRTIRYLNEAFLTIVVNSTIKATFNNFSTILFNTIGTEKYKILKILKTFIKIKIYKCVIYAHTVLVNIALNFLTQIPKRQCGIFKTIANGYSQAVKFYTNYLKSLMSISKEVQKLLLWLFQLLIWKYVSHCFTAICRLNLKPLQGYRASIWY